MVYVEIKFTIITISFWLTSLGSKFVFRIGKEFTVRRIAEFEKWLESGFRLD
jgi:hypothetical protein